MYSLQTHYDEIRDKQLRVTLENGHVYQGDFLEIESGIETDSQYDLLEIDVGGKEYTRVFYEDEIASIEVM